MVVDSSALIAIFFGEAEAFALTTAIVVANPNTVISTPTLLETAIVLERSGIADARETLDDFTAVTGLIAVPFDVEQFAVARETYRRYGKGNGHRASLNFGDCFSYALAKVRDDSLLFKGDDFSATDIAVATFGQR